MSILQENITAYIPQRPPFVMIDNLVGCDETCSNTTLQVTAENVLVYNGELSEAGLMENIAQTAAAGVGYVTLKNNEPILVGYIAGVKNLEIFALPKVGDVIETTVIIKTQVFDVTIISGSIKCKDELLATCEMKIFIKK
jgi:predicted hotdog family 3-hydroxylacyl-ACP dehydratase